MTHHAKLFEPAVEQHIKIVRYKDNNDDDDNDDDEEKDRMPGFRYARKHFDKLVQTRIANAEREDTYVFLHLVFSFER